MNSPYRSSAVSPPSACQKCKGDKQVCNECEKPGADCKCTEMPTPMDCPDCTGEA